MTTRVMLVSPAFSTALREARFPERTDHGATDPTPARGADATTGTAGVTTGTGTRSGTHSGAGAGAGAPGTVDASGTIDALDPLGLRQAEAVRETFPRAAALYVSPSHRCRRTAEILGLDTEPLSDLAPCAMGRWQGRTLDEIVAEEPESVAAWLSDPASAPHGGESLLTLHTRVGHWLDGLGSDSGEDSGGHVIAVAEPDIIRAAAVHALGASPQSFWRIDVQPLCVIELSGRDGRWNLLAGRPLRTAAP
ncbi:histidine phosphatase family protein [Streptomyces sp. NPDC056672]|uniref:histidine phosphatase family protein n=1 Tax=Streptomyces sp. NPDC056672 TaxID=3345906 RepID=UPI0036CFFE9A